MKVNGERKYAVEKVVVSEVIDGVMIAQ